jgi:hypothetical protein
MLIANQKIKENIAEYVVYMFQVETIIRSLDLDIEKIYTYYICQMTSNEDARQDVKEWYSNIIAEMKKDKITESGHIRKVHETLDELNFLHSTLLTSLEDAEYQEVFSTTSTYIKELQSREEANTLNDIETCFTGLYGKLTLKIQKKEISEETNEAFDAFTKLISILSVRYKDFKSGNLKFQINN